MSTTETVAGAAGEASEKGMPQLNFATWPNQVFWLLVALVIIYIVMTKIAMPRIAAVLAERKGRLGGDLAAAEELKSKAKAAETAYNLALEQARLEAAKIIAATKAEIQKDLNAAMADADAQISAKAAESEKRIAEIRAGAVQAVAEVARESGRTLCFAGRSLHRIIEAAQANGYLKDMPKTVDMESVDSLPRRDIMVVATGGQGEARAALARISEGNHPVKLQEGDTVIFSSKQIPGNEIAIGVIMNKLAERNILTVTEKQAHVHVSGHPGQPELAALYDWVRPEILIPVHGERRHMAEQARFARAHGVPKAVVQSNGDVVRLAPGEPKIIGKERTGRLILDGDTIIAADGATLNERRRLSWYGLISVAFALDAKDRMLGNPEIRLHGVPIEEDLEDFLEEAAAAAVKAVKDHRGDYDKLRETVRLAVRRVAVSWTGKKPIVDVLIVETA